MKTRLMLAVFMITLVSVAAIGCHSNLSQLIPSPANTMTPTPTSNANQVSCPDDANMAIYNYMSDLATTSHGLDVLAAFQQVFSEWGAASFWPNSQITSGSYG